MKKLFSLKRGLLVLGWTALLLPSFALAADAPKFAGSPDLEKALPRGWHRGGTIEVELFGRELYEPEQVVFYGEGIEAVKVVPLEYGLKDSKLIRAEKEAERLEKQREREQKNAKNKNKNNDRKKKQSIKQKLRPLKPGTRVVATFRIAKDCPTGEHTFRLLTRDGLSDSCTFWVGKFPTTIENERIYSPNANNEPATAEAVKMNHTLNAVLGRGDTDFFKVTAKKGQLVSIELEGARLATFEQRQLVDLALEVTDPSGKSVASESDSTLFVEDPFISFVAKEDGDYVIHVSEEVPGTTSTEMPYRLHIGSFLRPSGVYPAGGSAGQETQVRVLGIPDEFSKPMTVSLPAEEGSFDWYADGGTPSPNPMRVIKGVNVLETEPNGSLDELRGEATALPAAFNGIISKSGDVDGFRFRASKGSQWKVRLFGRSLGAPIDAKMSILSAGGKRAGKRLANAEDSDTDTLGLIGMRSSPGQLDPSLIFKVPEDGEYFLQVEDTRGEGGEDFVYRVEATAVQDGWFTSLRSYNNNNPRFRNRVVLSRGNQYMALIGLQEMYGNQFEGDMKLVARGLPQGVVMHAPMVKGGETQVPVIFQARGNAQLGAALIDIIAVRVNGSPDAEGKDEEEKAADRAANRVHSEFRQALSFTNMSGNYAMHYVQVKKLALAVTEKAAFRIEVESPKAAVMQRGEMPVSVRLFREPGFDDEIEILAEYLPQGMNRATPVILKKGMGKAEYIFGARPDARPGKYRLAISAMNRGGDRNTGAGKTFVSSKFFDIEVAEPYVNIKMSRASVQRGKTSEIACKVEIIKPFEGKARVTLARLPDGVELDGGPAAFGADEKGFTIKVKASPDCLVGLYKSIYCDVEFTEQGSTVRQASGYGQIRVDPAREKKGKKGKK